MSASIRIDGEPISYEAEAEAGVSFTTSERWWGTRVKWRRGTAGRWNHFSLIGVHPFDHATVEHGIRAYFELRAAHK